MNKNLMIAIAAIVVIGGGYYQFSYKPAQVAEQAAIAQKAADDAAAATQKAADDAAAAAKAAEEAAAAEAKKVADEAAAAAATARLLTLPLPPPAQWATLWRCWTRQTLMPPRLTR